MRRPVIHGAAGAAAALLAACSGLPWGAGLGGDPPGPVAPVPNGLVVVVGPEAVADAEQAASDGLDAVFADGLLVSGAVDLPLNVNADGVAATLWFAEAPFTPIAATLSPGPAGLEVAVSLQVPPVAFTISDPTGASCTATLSAAGARLTAMLGVDADKLGQVKAKATGAASLHFDAPTLAAGTCGFEGDYGVEAALLEALTRGLATALGEHLTPVLAARLPADLGLALTMRAEAHLDDGALGEGTVRWVVRPPESTGSGWVQLVGERLVVPFVVDFAASRHTCTPDADLPVASARPIPRTDPDRAAWLVNLDVLRRGLVALWAAGGLCGDRATAGLTLSARELTDHWPALARLPADARLEARLWPEEAPDVAAAQGVDGPEMTVKSGRVAAEVYATIDGARLRLATVRGEVELSGAVVVDAEGLVRLQPLDVRLTAVGAEPGLLGTPDERFAPAFIAALAIRLGSHLPLVQLPPAAAAGGPAAARVEGGYLVITQ